jgi:hypothetical protein
MKAEMKSTLDNKAMSDKVCFAQSLYPVDISKLVVTPTRHLHKNCNIPILFLIPTDNFIKKMLLKHIF